MRDLTFVVPPLTLEVCNSNSFNFKSIIWEIWPLYSVTFNLRGQTYCSDQLCSIGNKIFVGLTNTGTILVWLNTCISAQVNIHTGKAAITIYTKLMSLLVYVHFYTLVSFCVVLLAFVINQVLDQWWTFVFGNTEKTSFYGKIKFVI